MGLKVSDFEMYPKLPLLYLLHGEHKYIDVVLDRRKSTSDSYFVDCYYVMSLGEGCRLGSTQPYFEL